MAEASAAQAPREPRGPGDAPGGAPRQPPAGGAGDPGGAGGSGDADGRRWVRGVAAVPRRPAAAQPDTSDLPAVGPGAAGTRQPATRATRDQPARGLVVRWRGRRLRSGAGWTWMGLSFVLVCWGIWAVSVRGTDLLGPLVGLGLVLATGVLLFVLARLLGRTVLEGALGRPRPSAWPSHLTVCGFLVLAGVAFLQQTWWVQDSWQGLGDAWQWLGDVGSRLADLWPR